MKVLLLGATGRTGKIILHTLLERGYAIRVLVRASSVVGLKSEFVEVLRGDVTDVADLAKAADGCQAVISALNVSRTSDFPWARLRTPTTLLSDTMKALIRVTHQANLRRVVICSAWGVGETRKDIPWWFRWLIDHSNIGPAYADHERQEVLLMKSGLAYTIVRPVALLNFNKKTPVVVTQDNHPRPGMTVSRQAVARFMVQQLAGVQYQNDIVTISQRRS